MFKQQLACRGVRGATQVSANETEAILEATRNLLKQIVTINDIDAEDITSIFLTATPDLNRMFPAMAARQLGWSDVPLLCAQEISVPGSLERVVRVLLHWNTVLTQSQISHVYMNGAEILRPDQSAQRNNKGS